MKERKFHKKKNKIGWHYARNGIKEIIIREKNFRIHLYIFLIVLFFGFIFQINKIEWMIVLLISCIVLVSESINSIIEKLLDYIEPRIRQEVKIMKDMAAGAVLIAALFAIIIGLLIFLPKMIEFIVHFL